MLRTKLRQNLLESSILSLEQHDRRSMGSGFKIKTTLLLVALITPVAATQAGHSALSSERLKFYHAIRTEKLRLACNYTLPSSQDDVLLVFPRSAAQPMLILIRDQVLLAVHSPQGPRILGAIQFSPAIQGSKLIRGLFHGPYRVICGTFKLSGLVWKTPMTYYAIGTRQGEIISGTLDQQGEFTGVKSYTYGYDGPPFRLPSLPSE